MMPVDTVKDSLNRQLPKISSFFGHFGKRKFWTYYRNKWFFQLMSSTKVELLIATLVEEVKVVDKEKIDVGYWRKSKVITHVTFWISRLSWFRC